MPRTISASVGVRAANVLADVRTVQELLNKVPAVNGGPPTPLDVDGIVGPKTIAAITAFQRKQFGSAGADGRVDPGRRTLSELNAFDIGPRPVPAPPPKLQSVSRQFALFPVNPGDQFGTSPLKRSDFYFKVVQIPFQESAVYWLGNGGFPLPVPTQFNGKPALMDTRGPHSIDDLECFAAISSKGLSSGAETNLTLILSSGGITFPLATHIAEPGNPRSVSGFGARFNLVRVLRK